MNLHILILTYNCRQIIENNINLFYKNTNYNDYKIFILDNGSKDDTPIYLRSLAKEKDNIYINFQEKNLGIVKGRNKCYQFSQEIDNEGNIVFFIDADQLVQPGWLESYLEMMKNYDIVGCEAWSLNRNLYPYKRLKSREDSSYFSYVGCGGLMIKNKVIKDIGLFDERYYQFFEDPDYCWSAHEKGYKIGWNCNSIIVHNHEGPLLTEKNRLHFSKSWSKFRNKWKMKKQYFFEK